jgi:hypothetical protein
MLAGESTGLVAFFSLMRASRKPRRFLADAHAKRQITVVSVSIEPMD